VIYGKGGKTRAINLPASLWSELQALQGDAEVDTPPLLSNGTKNNVKAESSVQ